MPDNHDHQHDDSTEQQLHSHEEGHDHEHGHDHPHPHPHDHSHEGDHDHGTGLKGWLGTVFHLHGHSHQNEELTADRAFMNTEAGIRTVWLALAALLITSLIQIAIVTLSGSVSLLADTVHNIGDMLNSIPLLIAFYLARRVATRRYTYGFGKAEDVAMIFIVLSIAVSAGVIFYESIRKFIDPEPMTNLGWVALAAVVGFLGNEAVALFQIRTGRRIGSAALVADGMHARTDGLTSLAVLLAAGATWLGYPIVDPIIGVLIGVTILFITRDALVTMWYRLMDAIDPEMVDQAEGVVARQPGVEELARLRMRWVGHSLHAEITIAVDPRLTTLESHAIAEQARHALFHEFPSLAEVVVHVDPLLDPPEAAHRQTLHHEAMPRPLAS